MIFISLKISISKNLLYCSTVSSIKKKNQNNLNRYAYLDKRCPSKKEAWINEKVHKSSKNTYM